MVEQEMEDNLHFNIVRSLLNKSLSYHIQKQEIDLANSIHLFHMSQYSSTALTLLQN
jgi:hypothetical protein